jgi:pimeloyl-ACP methyl ester carboxylesterase
MTRPSLVLLALFGALLVLAVTLLPFVVLAWVTPGAPALIETQGARLADFPGGVIRYEDEGTGTHALVLLHGFNGQLGHWNQVWDGLGSCGRRIRLDIPGYGGSEWHATSYSLQDQAERVVAFLDSRGVTTATLVGGSMGGSLTAWMAAHYPDRVDQIGLLAPSGYTGALRYSGLLGLLVRPGWLNRQATVIARSSLYATLFPKSRALQMLTVTASYGPDWVAALGRIRAPTLILWSTGDEGVSHTTALDVRQAIAGSTLIWLDKQTGHQILGRHALVADIACQLANGVSPADVGMRLQPPLLRPGESYVAPARTSSDK